MRQALSVNSLRKYQSDGGATVKHIMALLLDSDNSKVDRDRFMRAQALNYVIAGTDAHARNYSIVYAPGGAFRLAPLYDPISDLPYAGDRRESSLAMGIAGHRVLKEIIPRHWEALAADVGFDAGQAIGHVRDIVARAVARAADEASALVVELRGQGLRNDTLDRLVKELSARCKGLERVYGAEAVDVTN